MLELAAATSRLLMPIVGASGHISWKLAPRQSTSRLLRHLVRRNAPARTRILFRQEQPPSPDYPIMQNHFQNNSAQPHPGSLAASDWPLQLTQLSGNTCYVFDPRLEGEFAQLHQPHRAFYPLTQNPSSFWETPTVVEPARTQMRTPGADAAR